MVGPELIPGIPGMHRPIFQILLANVGEKIKKCAITLLSIYLVFSGPFIPMSGKCSVSGHACLKEGPETKIQMLNFLKPDYAVWFVDGKSLFDSGCIQPDVRSWKRGPACLPPAASWLPPASWLLGYHEQSARPSMPIRIPSQIAVDCKSVHSF